MFNTDYLNIDYYFSLLLIICFKEEIKENKVVIENAFMVMQFSVLYSEAVLVSIS